MPESRAKYFFLMAAIVTFAQLGSACLRQPQVETDQATMIFTHTNLLTKTCNECHEKDRPIALSASEPHGDGLDCNLCHKPDTAKAWNDLENFDHTPRPSSCTGCHKLSDFTPAPHSEWGDCTSCHGTTLWSDYVFFHSSEQIQPGKCSECHSDDRPTSGQWMDQAFGVNKTDSHYGAVDCFSCHTTSNQFKDWDDLNTSHYNAANQKIQTCMPCHYQSPTPSLDNAPNIEDVRLEQHFFQNAYFTPPFFDMNSDVLVPDPSGPQSGPLGNCFQCHDVERLSFGRRL